MGNLIKNAGYTQVQFAKLLNVSQALVWQWTKGICQPRIEQLPYIAKLLNVSMDEVVNCFNNSITKPN